MFIKNPVRFHQLNRICIHYGIPFNNTLSAPVISLNNSWFSGFFDADGTVTYNKTNHQLAISVSQKTPELLNSFKLLFGGNIYPDRGLYPSYKWYISNQESILLFLSYIKNNPSRSAKRNRLFLIPTYYQLKNLKAHLAPVDSILFKAWKNFLSSWSST